MQRHAARNTPSVQTWEFEGYYDEWYPEYEKMRDRFVNRMNVKFKGNPSELTVQVLEDDALKTVNKGKRIKLRVEARKAYSR
jgi:hypothetical protein